MSVTVEQVARDVLAAVDTTAGHVLVAKYVADRYRRIAARARFRHLRQVGSLLYPAVISTGTVTVTQGSRTVTPDATALAAWVNAGTVGGTPAIVGRHIRITSSVWYELTDFNGTVAQLVVPYAEASVAGTAYYIAERRTKLSPEARWLGDFVHMRRRVPLDNYSLAELDRTAPDRALVGTQDGPAVWAEVNADVAGTKIVEFYPYNSQPELINYVYWSHPPQLAFGDVIPAPIDSYVLMEGALIDVMRYEASQAARHGNVEAAAYWTNSYRAQSTAWERIQLDAIRGDQGVDDVSFVLQFMKDRSRPRDITTARDIAYDRWPL